MSPEPTKPAAVASSAGPVPVSGAWVPGDPPGCREFAPVGRGRSFQLEAGGQLSEVMVAYETWGELNAAASNAVLVPHALTGDSHAAGRAGPAAVIWRSEERRVGKGCTYECGSRWAPYH